MDWDCRCFKVQTIVVTETYYNASTKKGQVDYKLTEQIKEKYKKAKVLIRKGRFLLPSKAWSTLIVGMRLEEWVDAHLQYQRAFTFSSANR